MSESGREVDGMRRSDRGRRTDSVKVEERVEEGGMDGERGRHGKVEKERRKGEKASCRKKKYNDTIIKYKRWDTYYGDYCSFPYI